MKNLLICQEIPTGSRHYHRAILPLIEFAKINVLALADKNMPSETKTHPERPIMKIGDQHELRRALERIRDLEGSMSDTPQGLELEALQDAVLEFQGISTGTCIPGED
jgi:hypothetical protein